MTSVSPNQTAEQLAQEIEARACLFPSGKSRVLSWAATRVREVFSAKQPSPIVLIQIDPNSRLGVLRSDEVFVAYMDEREAFDEVTVLPVRNDLEEILAKISGRPIVSIDEDFEDVALTTINRIARGAVIVAKIENSK